ncbi:MAG TPA: Bpu10I family restriction endonuclease [Terracidiphilus sp.]|nr:Bpu10I family restriction endonuclease [Terracidiphilus sp.]
MVDKPRLASALERYAAWNQFMDGIDAEGDALLAALIQSLNQYKRFIEVDLIFDSPADFLYRQKGQHKVDNSVLEEFLPRLADTRLVPGLSRISSCTVGPQGAFAAFVFSGNVHSLLSDGGLFIKQKDQDYALSKRVYLKASTDPGFEGVDTLHAELNVAYLAAECKTNLDKTMFNEALETARSLKQAVSCSRYLLLCEWLDMGPIDTASTDIEEVIILRKAKRMGASFRAGLATASGRALARTEFVNYYDANPFSVECFRRVVEHINGVFPEALELDEATILQRGYF